MLLSLLLAAAVSSAAPQEPTTTPPEAGPALQASMPPGAGAMAQGYIDAGLAAFKRRRYAQAESEFAKAVEADPQSAAAHFYLGYTAYKRAEPKRPFHPDKQRAAALFAKAYELEPSFRPVWGPRRP